MAREFESFEEMVREQAMGDEDATRYVAHRLAKIDEWAAQGGPPADPALKQKEEELAKAQHALLAQRNWLNALHNARKRHPDVYGENDEEAQRRAGEIIGAYIKTSPELTYDQALDQAAEATRAQLGDPESRDYGSAIARERFFRQHGRKPAEGVTLESDDDVSQGSAITPEDLDRAAAIATMAADRRGHVNEAAERERERRAKEAGRTLAAMRARRGYVADGTEE
jgi:hypothetical protein